MRTMLLLGLAFVIGCSRDDGDKLTRVARLTAEKVREAAPRRTPLGELDPEKTPAGRVRARLRTDASLAGHSIQVVEAADGLHLRGRVPTRDQADWASRLARETVGVPAVIDEIVVGP